MVLVSEPLNVGGAFGFVEYAGHPPPPYTLVGRSYGPRHARHTAYWPSNTTIYTNTTKHTNTSRHKKKKLKYIKYTNKILYSSPNANHNTTRMHNTVFHSPHNSTINLCSASTQRHMNEEILSEKNGVGIRKNVQKLKKDLFFSLQKLRRGGALMRKENCTMITDIVHNVPGKYCSLQRMKHFCHWRLPVHMHDKANVILPKA